MINVKEEETKVTVEVKEKEKNHLELEKFEKKEGVFSFSFKKTIYNSDNIIEKIEEKIK